MSRPRTWWLVMLGRVVVLAALASAAFALVGAPGTGARFVCPMHPDVVLDEPGVCPICQMALVDGGTAAPPTVPRAPLTAAVVQRQVAAPARVPAWVELDGRVASIVYRDDLIGAAPGQPAAFARASAPNEVLDVAWTDAPPLAWDGATVKIWFDGRDLTPGDEGTLLLPARPHEVLAVPTSAILASGDGPCVVVREAAGFVRRRVATGRVQLGTTAILSGLTVGEQVVVEAPRFVEHAP